MKSELACVFVAAAVFGLGVTGCGDDDDSGGDSTAAALTQEEFIAQADEICAESGAEIDAAGEELFGSDSGQTEADFEAFVTETVVPGVQEQVAAIEELPAPEGDEEQITALLDAVNEAVAEVEADPVTLTTTGEPFAEANKLASDYGLTDCAN